MVPSRREVKSVVNLPSVVSSVIPQVVPTSLTPMDMMTHDVSPPTLLPPLLLCHPDLSNSFGLMANNKHDDDDDDVSASLGSRRFDRLARHPMASRLMQAQGKGSPKGGKQATWLALLGLTRTWTLVHPLTCSSGVGTCPAQNLDSGPFLRDQGAVCASVQHVSLDQHSYVCM